MVVQFLLEELTGTPLARLMEDVVFAPLGMPLREGLGVMLSAAGEPFSFGHPGDNYPGASCWVTAYPDVDVGIAIMTNGAMGNLLALEIMPAFVEEYVRPRKR